jgi:hypothetical protein
MKSHPHSPEPCKSCHWALEGLKRPSNPTPEQIAEMDACCGCLAERAHLIDDSRGKKARLLMDKTHPHLRPPILSQNDSFWEDYGEQIVRLLPHKTHKQQEYFLGLMLEFYPNGSRYV